jgi:hypothetical protein
VFIHGGSSREIFISFYGAIAMLLNSIKHQKDFIIEEFELFVNIRSSVEFLPGFQAYPPTKGFNLGAGKWTYCDFSVYTGCINAMDCARNEEVS